MTTKQLIGRMRALKALGVTEFEQEGDRIRVRFSPPEPPAPPAPVQLVPPMSEAEELAGTPSEFWAQMQERKKRAAEARQ